MRLSVWIFHFFRNVRDGFFFLTIVNLAFWAGCLIGWGSTIMIFVIAAFFFNIHSSFHDLADNCNTLIKLGAFIGGLYFLGAYKDKIIEKLKD